MEFDRATIALILSIIALVLSATKWVRDFAVERLDGKYPRQRKGNELRVEFLEGQTNCFITRGGFLLFLVSFRVYNDNDHAPAVVQNCRCQAKIGRKWRETDFYDAPQAAIFPSLIRNTLPITLAPEERQDFYEVFALDELIPSTEIRVRLQISNKTGKTAQCRDGFTHRVDERPVFDMLFRILE